MSWKRRDNDSDDLDFDDDEDITESAVSKS